MTPENFDIDKFESAFKAGAKVSTAPPPDLFDQIINKSTINNPAGPIAGAEALPSEPDTVPESTTSGLSNTFYWIAASVLVIGGITAAVLLNSDNDQDKAIPTVVDPTNGKPSPDSNHQPADSTSHQHQDVENEEEINEVDDTKLKPTSSNTNLNTPIAEGSNNASVNIIEDEEVAPIEEAVIDEATLTSNHTESITDLQTESSEIAAEENTDQDSISLLNSEEQKSKSVTEDDRDPFKSFIEQNESNEDQIQLFDKKKQSGN